MGFEGQIFLYLTKQAEKRWEACAKLWDKKMGSLYGFFMSAFYVAYGSLLEQPPLATANRVKLSTFKINESLA